MESAFLRPAGPYAIGDRIQLRAVLRTPSGAAPQAEPPPSSSEASYGAPSWTQTRPGVWEMTASIQVFRVGAYSLESYWASAGGRRLEIRPGTVQMRSVRSGAEAEILKGPKPPADLRRPWRHTAYALLFLLTAGGAIFWMRRRSSKPTPATPAPRVETPEERLERALSRLETRLAEGTDPRGAAYAEAADALRVYIAERSAVPAPRLPSSLTLNRLRNALGEGALDDLSKTLCEADRVKFAALLPDAAAERAGIQAAPSGRLRSFSRRLKLPARSPCCHSRENGNLSAF